MENQYNSLFWTGAQEIVHITLEIHFTYCWELGSKHRFLGIVAYEVMLLLTTAQFFVNRLMSYGILTPDIVVHP